MRIAIYTIALFKTNFKFANTTGVVRGLTLK